MQTMLINASDNNIQIVLRIMRIHSFAANFSVTKIWLVVTQIRDLSLIWAGYSAKTAIQIAYFKTPPCLIKSAELSSNNTIHILSFIFKSKIS